MALSKSKPSCTDELGGKKKSLNMIIKTRKVEGTKFNLHATLLVRDRKKSLYCICILYLCNSLTLVVEFSVQLYKGGSI